MTNDDIRMSGDLRTVHDHTLHDMLMATSTGLVGAALATADDRGDVRWAAVGERSRQGAGVVSDRTLFEIGSITKLATAAVICQLADEQRIALDVPISRWLAAMAAIDGGASITARHLLCHSAGLADLWEAAESPEAMVDRLNSYGLLASPGELLSYSNPGYVLLGHLIERVTGRSWAENVRGRIVEPLGLTDILLGDEPNEPSDIALDHRVDAATSLPYVAPMWPKIGQSYAAAGSTMKASIVDACRLGAALLFGRAHADACEILAPGALYEMQRLQISMPGTGTFGSGWGLGWNIMETLGNCVGHQGGSTAYMLGSRHYRKVAVFLSNTANGWQIGLPLVRTLAGLRTSVSPEPSTAKPRKDLAGHYMSPTMSVHVRDSRYGLTMTGPIDGADIHLTSIGDDGFLGWVGGGNTEITFLRRSCDAGPSHLHILSRALPRVVSSAVAE